MKVDKKDDKDKETKCIDCKWVLPYQGEQPDVPITIKWMCGRPALGCKFEEKDTSPLAVGEADDVTLDGMLNRVGNPEPLGDIEEGKLEGVKQLIKRKIDALEKVSQDYVDYRIPYEQYHKMCIAKETLETLLEEVDMLPDSKDATRFPNSEEPEPPDTEKKKEVK
jgi:hypothetical protein